MRNRRGRNQPSRARGATTLVLVCAAAAGAHAGLVPAHLNSEPRLGVAFLIAVALLVAAATAVATRPRDRRVASATGLLLASLMFAYLATRTTGIPWLDPEPEALDTVGIATNAVEALGVVVALWLIHPFGRQVRPTHLQEASQ